MSAAIEGSRSVSFRPDNLLRSVTARAGRILRVQEVTQSAKSADYFDNFPKLFDAQIALATRDINSNLFVARAAEELVDGLETTAKIGTLVAAPVVIGGILSACSSPKEVTPLVSNVNTSAQTVACEPEKYARELGIPTPVSIGVAAPDNIVLIRAKLEKCDPISDDEKQQVIQFNIQHPQLGSAPSSESVSQPSPVEQAIKDGKIELNNLPTNSTMPLSPNESRVLLEKVNNKFILSLKPTMVPNLALETVKYKMPGGEATALGMKNIPSGTVFPAFTDGIATLMPTITTGGTKSVAVEIKFGENTYGILARREGLQSPLPPNEPVAIKIGDPLFTLGTEDALGFYQGGQQVIIKLNQGDPNKWDAAISNLVVKNGQLAYLNW